MIDFDKKNFVHFIGVGEKCLCSLAFFCARLGWKVSASVDDIKIYKNLPKKYGFTLNGYSKSNVDAFDFVVVGDNLQFNNVELSYVRKLGIKIYKESEFWVEILSKFKNILAFDDESVCITVFKILTESKKTVSIFSNDLVYLDEKNFDVDYFILNINQQKKLTGLSAYICAVKDFNHLDFSTKNKFITILKNSKEKYIIKKRLNIKNLVNLKFKKISKNLIIYDGEIYVVKDIGKINSIVLILAVCKRLNIDENVISKYI